MSLNGCLDRAQRTMLIRALVELADDNNHIPHFIAEICAKVAERMGRSISDMTVRQYLKDGGFTWKNGRISTKLSSADRIGELARIIQHMRATIGVSDEDDELLQRIINKRSMTTTKPCT